MTNYERQFADDEIHMIGNELMMFSELQVLQNNAAKVLLGLPTRSSSTQALKSLDFKPLALRRFFHRCTETFQCAVFDNIKFFC